MKIMKTLLLTLGIPGKFLAIRSALNSRGVPV